MNDKTAEAAPFDPPITVNCNSKFELLNYVNIGVGSKEALVQWLSHIPEHATILIDREEYSTLIAEWKEEH